MSLVYDIIPSFDTYCSKSLLETILNDDFFEIVLYEGGFEDRYIKKDRVISLKIFFWEKFKLKFNYMYDENTYEFEFHFHIYENKIQLYYVEQQRFANNVYDKLYDFDPQEEEKEENNILLYQRVKNIILDELHRGIRNEKNIRYEHLFTQQHIDETIDPLDARSGANTPQGGDILPIRAVYNMHNAFYLLNILRDYKEDIKVYTYNFNGSETHVHFLIGIHSARCTFYPRNDSIIVQHDVYEDQGYYIQEKFNIRNNPAELFHYMFLKEITESRLQNEMSLTLLLQEEYRYKRILELLHSADKNDNKRAEQIMAKEGETETTITQYIQTTDERKDELKANLVQIKHEENTKSLTLYKPTLLDSDTDVFQSISDTDLNTGITRSQITPLISLLNNLSSHLHQNLTL